MIKQCQCGIKYNEETIEKCPICFPTEEIKEKTIFYEMIKDLRTCVSLSRKGKHHKPPSGMHIVYDKKFRVKVI